MYSIIQEKDVATITDVVSLVNENRKFIILKLKNNTLVKIKGTNIFVSHFHVYSGELIISGTIKSFKIIDNFKKKSLSSFLKRSLRKAKEEVNS